MSDQAADHAVALEATVQVLRRIESIFGADPERAEETFYVADPSNSVVAYVSSSYERVWGRAREGLHADPLNWMKSIHPDDLRRVREAFSQRERRGSMDIEYRIVRPDEQVRYIHDRSYLHTVADETFVIGRCKDVTDMRAAQSELIVRAQEREWLVALGRQALRSEHYRESLAEMAATLRQALQACAVEILSFDGANTLTVEAIRSRGVEPWPVGTVLGASETALAAALASGELAVPLDLSTGARRFAALGFSSGLGIPVRHAEGSCLGVIGVYARPGTLLKPLDIPFTRAMVNIVWGTLNTEVQQRRLRSREALLRQLCDHLDDVFWIRDMLNGGLAYVSPAYERIFGDAPGDLAVCAVQWYSAIVPEDRARVEDLFTGQPAATPIDRSYRIENHRGEQRRIRERSFPVLEASGEMIYLIGLAQDVTDAHRAAEDRLNLEMARAAERSAQAQVKARDDVLAIVSHDLRNPLAAVQMLSERLTKAGTDAQRGRYVDGIRRAVDRMSRLLGDLLTVSQMEAGQFHLERAPTDVQE
ncbi:MAG TPA: PAS domain-containing protein, partial [Myxococcota bacterium]|nr:PAS domain-containing protein [Myxococcota bacterium]